jgi:hypothetical protein
MSVVNFCITVAALLFVCSKLTPLLLHQFTATFTITEISTLRPLLSLLTTPFLFSVSLTFSFVLLSPIRYIVPRVSGQLADGIQLKILALIGGGAKALKYFTFGPGVTMIPFPLIIIFHHPHVATHHQRQRQCQHQRQRQHRHQHPLHVMLCWCYIRHTCVT